jgi:hypothetical protein
LLYWVDTISMLVRQQRHEFSIQSIPSTEQE